MIQHIPMTLHNKPSYSLNLPNILINMRNGKLLAVLIFLLFTREIHAQENVQRDTTKINSDQLLSLPFEDLMNVRVITPTQSLQKSNQVPATVLVVTMDQIKLRGYRNLAEIVNDLPDFIVNDKSDPQFYNAISVRGIFRQDHFVILLDGVRISSPTNEPLPLLENFPIYLAKQIEIVYGPGSALYGADAMAGVINIITQKAGDAGNVNVTAMGGTQGYGNATAFVNKKLRNDTKLSIAGQYSYDAQPDFSKVYKNEFDMTSQQTGVFNTSYGPVKPQQPVNPKYEAPIKAFNVYASLDKGRFSMKILHHYAGVPSSTTLKPNNAVYNKDVFYGQGVTIGSASYTAGVGKLKSISTLIGSFYKVDPQSNFRNLYGGVEHGYKYSTGSMMKIEEQLSYSLSRKIHFIGGLTYELFQSVPKSPELQSVVTKTGSVSGILLNSTSVNNPSGIEAKFFPLMYNNIGAYLQGQYFPIDKLSFTAGLRYDNNSRFGSTINPRIGAVYNVLKKTTIKALYGTAFWAPSPMVSFESYGSFYTVDSGNTYQSDFWHLPNPGLKPMTSQTMELSINQKIGKRLDITLTVYKTHIDNIIKNVSDNGNTNLYNNKFLGWNVAYIEVPFNEGSQNNYGGNLKINNAFNLGTVKLNSYSSISYVDGKVSESGASSEVKEVESVITPWQFRLGLDGKLKAFQFSIRLLKAGQQRMAGFLDTNNPYKRKTISGYSLLNLSVGYTIMEKITFFINAQNALNEHYRNSLSWDPSDSNAPSFNGSFQNPLRVMTGIRVGF